jgi:mannose-6-phosphate isomerase-like protein (cupin superfamily)
MAQLAAFDLGTFSAFADPSGVITPEALDNDFWTRRVLEFGDGQLISRFSTDCDWANWEMHPHGDELIFQISGKTEFTIEGFEAPVALFAGNFIIVPSGHWHIAKCLEAGEALYITNGKDTQHRPR